MMELEIMCYYTLSCSNSLHGLFEILEPTQMDKGVKFVPMYNMKLHNIIVTAEQGGFWAHMDRTFSKLIEKNGSCEAGPYFGVVYE